MSRGSGVSRSDGQPVGTAAAGEPAAFLERADSMAMLERLLDDVRSGSEGRLVLVGGEAGVGKTTLLLRFCERHGTSARILWGACEPLRTPRPLGPVLDVAEATGGELADLVEGVARPFEVAAGLVRELGARGPTVLILEDVHWADEATLDVLTLLAGRIASTPALVLASYRDDELGRADQLRVLLGEVIGRHGRLKLEPLSRAGVTELAEHHGIEGEELYRRTQGNPFFVTEVLAAGGEQISETVRDAVLARAGRLSERARRLLDAVAVVPGTVDLSLLEAVAGELVDELEECLASGVLTAGSAHVAFRHELARLAIEEAVAPNRRRALHRAALAALASRAGEHPEVARLAHHAEAAGDGEGVLRWAPAAAEQAARSGAHREAAAQYLRALRFADGLPDEQRSQLLARRVDECWLTDQFDAAIEAQEQLLACRRGLGDGPGEGDALRTLSRLLFFVGRVQEGETLARDAVALLERLAPGHELAMAYGNLSQRRMVLEDVDEAVAWGTRALEIARSIDDTEALVYALTNIGAAEFDAGSDDGRIKLERALAIALRNGLEDYAGRAYPTIVRCAVRQRRFDLATTYLGPGLEYCGERGLDTWRLYLLAARARLELHTGRWDEAAASAAEVLRDSRSAPFPRASSMTVLGFVRARRGDPEPAAPLAEEEARASATGELDRIGSNAAARAEAAWLAGEPARVLKESDAALSLALERHAPWVVGELACWRWRAGARDALAFGAAAEPYALSIAGEWRAAAGQWSAIGCPYESALALADGDDEDALRDAIDALQTLGARPAAGIVMRRLRERGVRGVPRGPRPRTRENPAGLTPRELEVVVLLAEGMRNAQIAQRLVVSEKTIDHHVSAILRKLDVHTRGEAAAEAVRLGLTVRR
jgi:ATP/maltotriose-dependent transcriptional regulator MalT